MEAVIKRYTLQHADGTEVTAQEVYDAFMSGNVIIDFGDTRKGVQMMVKMTWSDTNGTQTDPTNVAAVECTLADGTSIPIGGL